MDSTGRYEGCFMSKKKREPIDWDELIKNPKEDDFKFDSDKATCMLPVDHHEMMRGERARAEKVPGRYETNATGTEKKPSESI